MQMSSKATLNQALYGLKGIRNHERMAALLRVWGRLSTLDHFFRPFRFESINLSSHKRDIACNTFSEFESPALTLRTHFESLCSVLIQGLSWECDVVLVGQCSQIEVILSVDTGRDVNVEL